MCRMLLSINPEHVENILSGKKKYEYRKARCRREITKIVIYATAPRQEVVAEAEVEEVIEGEPDEVWRRTRVSAGISYDFFKAYYEGKQKAIAYKLKNVETFDRPRTLSEYGVTYPPQSFVYLDAMA